MPNQMPTPVRRVVLKGPLTMRTATATCATLRKALSQSADITIDCGAATDVDLGFIQLLVAMQTSAQRLDKTVSLAGSPGGSLLKALTRTGFEPTGGAGGPFWFGGAAA